MIRNRDSTTSVPLTIERMRKQYLRLQKLIQKTGKKVDKEITSILKEFAEILIHGEKVSEQFFDFFLEENMLRDIIGIILQDRSNATKVQVIQTISILVQNIRNEKSLFFILSNNHINTIITAPLDFHDEDIVSQYISFMKMLSLSVNDQTIHFFHNNKNPSNPFPLFSLCSSFFDHPDGMVRIAARTITFNCLRVHNQATLDFMAQPGPQKYFRKLVYYIVSLIVTMDRCCRDHMFKEAGELAQNISDELFIIHDLMKCGVQCVESCIASTFLRSVLQNMCFPAILNSFSAIPPIPTKYDIQCETALFVLPLILQANPEGGISDCIEQFFLQDVTVLTPEAVETSSPVGEAGESGKTLFMRNHSQPLPLASLPTSPQSQHSIHDSWKVCNSQAEKSSATREIIAQEESDMESHSPTPIPYTMVNDSLLISLLTHLQDMNGQSEVLMCLLTMMDSRKQQKEWKWREGDRVKSFLELAVPSLISVIERMLRSPCCIDTMKLCYACLDDFEEAALHTIDTSFSLSILKDHCSSFGDSLKSLQYNANLYSVIATTALSFLRRMISFLEDPPKRGNPFVINRNSSILNCWRNQKQVVNSLRIGDEEEMSVYDVNEDVMVSEIACIFGKAVHYHLMFILLLCYHIKPHHPQLYQQSIQLLQDLLSVPTIQIGEQVRLNPSLNYIHCNILISSSTRLQSPHKGYTPTLISRLATIPAYFFIGETQCGVLEIHRGNTSVGYIRSLTKLYDVLDASIVSDNKRCLVLLMKSDKEMDYCTNKQYSQEQLELAIDKRYCYECRLYLRFTSSVICHDAYTKLFYRRTLYHQSICEKMLEVMKEMSDL